MLMSGSSALVEGVSVSMHMRCTAESAPVRTYRGGPAAKSQLRCREGSWTVFVDSFRYEDQISKCFQARNPWIPSLKFVAGAGFEPATSGQDRRAGSRYLKLWVPLENLGLIWRFSIGRCKVYRNALEPLPIISDDVLMTCRISRRVAVSGFGRGSRRGGLRTSRRRKRAIRTSRR